MLVRRGNFTKTLLLALVVKSVNLVILVIDIAFFVILVNSFLQTVLTITDFHVKIVAKECLRIMSTYKHANIVTKEHTKTNQNKQCVSTVCPGHLKIQLDPIDVKYVLRTQRAKEGELLNVLVVCLVKNQIKAVLNVPNAMLVKQVLVVMVLVINAKQVNIVRAA